MTTPPTDAGGLVPLADRIRWILLCRIVVVIVLPVLWRFADASHAGLVAVILPAVGWLVLTAPTVVLARNNRTIAVWSLNLALLGDGLLLCYVWWQLGALDGPVGYVVILHAVAVTLLASFRTGAKVAVWHSLLALVLLETSAAGFLGDRMAVPMSPLALYLGGMWATVVTTALFAAVNERELRRRRHDSEALRTFGLELARESESGRIAHRLASFTREELLADQAAVIVYPVRSGGDPVPREGFAVVVDQAGTTVRSSAPAQRSKRSVLWRTIDATAPVLLRKLERQSDPWLAELLPSARNLIIIPFRLEEVVGATIVVHSRWSSQRSSQRVERRVVETAQQAVAHAATAISRAILTDRIRAMADTDGLTGVANRRVFDASLLDTITLARAGTAPCAVIMVDLDHFKRLNDRYGHLVGDEVLRAAAGAIRESCREGDLAARFGGEEFAVILPHTDRDAALAAAERVHQAIRAVVTVAPITASVGVAVYPADGADAVAVLRAADEALYRAKMNGRDRVELGGGDRVAV